MKFYIKHIRLWFKNETTPRVLEFKQNKVNVVTGNKSTGKSSILSIIDYCLLSSRSRIVEEIINENVLWYGLNFIINDKNFYVARKRPFNNLVSNEIFFSSMGEVPDLPRPNMDIDKLKSIFEEEFGIDEKLVIPYGGNKIKAGSKISFRYFLLFNTQSEDVIASTSVYYDYNLHDPVKYMEALQRIFYLAVGIEEASNVLIKERIKSVEAEIDRLEKKNRALERNVGLFNNEIYHLMLQAQQFDLIERQLFTHEEALEKLNRLISEFRTPAYSNNLGEIESLNRSRRSIVRKIRKLERFDAEFAEYKSNLRNDFDSVRPVEYLKRHLDRLVVNGEVTTFINSLNNSLLAIKEEISKKQPLVKSVSKQLKQLQKELIDIDKRLGELPTDKGDIPSEINRFVFIGELKAKLNFLKTKWEIPETLPSSEGLERQLKELNDILQNTNQRRRVFVQFIEASIQKYFDKTNSLGVYQNYQVFFDEVDKSIKLRKPDDALPSANIGSKSNYMFLHLCLFLGLHTHMIKQKVQYTPQLLILDQPSQPYLEKSTIDPVTGLISGDDDRETIKDAFALLNSFISDIVEEHKEEFQIIMLEHAAEEYWNSPMLDNFHLVAEFRNGNALIPPYAIGENPTKSQQIDDIAG